MLVQREGIADLWKHLKCNISGIATATFHFALLNRFL